MIYDRYLPRQIREALDPSLKRKRLDEEDLRRIFQLVFRDLAMLAGQLRKQVPSYFPVSEGHLGEFVDLFIEWTALLPANECRARRHNMRRLLAGRFPKLVERLRL